MFGKLQPKSTAEDVQRTVQSAEVFTKVRLRETPADWAVRCTSVWLHSTNNHSGLRSRKMLFYEGVLSGVLGDGFQWRWGVTPLPWTSSLYLTETASILRSAFPSFLIITWRACRTPWCPMSCPASPPGNPLPFISIRFHSSAGSFLTKMRYETPPCSRP